MAAQGEKEAARMILAALEKRDRGEELSRGEANILAYGYDTSVCGQRYNLFVGLDCEEDE